MMEADHHYSKPQGEHEYKIMKQRKREEALQENTSVGA